jgi:DNA-directed RNA polymerase I, II, and III subunit RPABC3
MDLFSANFTVDGIDVGGKQFDGVSRIQCRSENDDSTLILDVNTNIYKMSLGDVFALVLSHQISSEPVSDSTHWHPSQLQNSNASKYEYVMHGKVYRYEEETAHHRATIYVSFGGLLMSLSGEQNALKDVPGGRNVYLLMRKIKS